MKESQIGLAFKTAKKENRPALLTYTVAGDNTKKNSLKILSSIAKYADILELGFPHNTPIADGGQIQGSSHRSLKNGIKLKDVFQIVKKFKKNNPYKPIILMGYFNLIYQNGENNFLKSCKLSGVDGLIIVEDTHSSYMEQFGNPQKFSFINFSKRNIDDLNFKFPDFSNLKNSLNDYIYSIQYFESIVVYHINKKKSYMNSVIHNNENLPKEIDDIRYEKSLFNNLNKNKFIKKIKFLKNYKIIYWLYKYMMKKIVQIGQSKKIKKYFK